MVEGCCTNESVGLFLSLSTPNNALAIEALGRASRKVVRDAKSWQASLPRESEKVGKCRLSVQVRLAWMGRSARLMQHWSIPPLFQPILKIIRDLA